jgi:hypothetical protein
LFAQPSASNFGMRLFRALLILEATYTLPIIGSIESVTYPLLEMELCLHHINKVCLPTISTTIQEKP